MRKAMLAFAPTLGHFMEGPFGGICPRMPMVSAQNFIRLRTVSGLESSFDGGSIRRTEDDEGMASMCIGLIALI